MKKFLLPLLALALSATAAAAQTTPAQPGGRPQRTPDEMAARQTQGLAKRLNLSADQAAKVQQIMLARDQEMQAKRGEMQNAATSNRKQVRDQMRADRAKYEDQLKAVLTPEQLTQYNAMAGKRRERGQGKRQNKMQAAPQTAQ